MTAPARITQADMERAIKSASKAERARVIFRLDRAEIEVIIGESVSEQSNVATDEWSDDDV